MNDTPQQAEHVTLARSGLLGPINIPDDQLSSIREKQLLTVGSLVLGASSAVLKIQFTVGNTLLP